MLKTINSLQGVNILSKQAQKKVQGGVAVAGGGSAGGGSGTCGVYLPATIGAGGTGAAVSFSGSEYYHYADGHSVMTGISSAIASQFMASYGAGAHWCCTNCGTASWMP